MLKTMQALLLLRPFGGREDDLRLSAQAYGVEGPGWWVDNAAGYLQGDQVTIECVPDDQFCRIVEPSAYECADEAADRWEEEP